MREDLSFLAADEAYASFARYVCVQYMRTNKRKEATLGNASPYKSINPDAIWNVLSHIFATNVAWTLFAERRDIKTVLLKNETPQAFITADQPVINAHATGIQLRHFVHDLEFYYPLSPRLAMLIMKDARYSASGTVTVSIEEVQRYNDQIALQSHTQIYASTRSDLERFAA